MISSARKLFSPGAGAQAWPLALYYTTMFSIGGVHLPYWPVWLASHGQGAAGIGVLIAAGVCVRIVANPWVAHMADRLGERRRPIVLLGWISLASFSLFAFAPDFAWLVAISLLFGFTWAPVGPLFDNLTLLTAYAEKLDYGRIRVWGSISFMAATALGGWILQGHSSELVLVLVLALLAANALCGHLLPDRRTARAEPAHGIPLARLLRMRLFALFVGGTSLIFASHAAYYGFFTLHLRSIGYGESIIGLLWSEGVVLEIALFFVSGSLFRRISPTNLILLGAVAGLVRWPTIALSTSLMALVAVQTLHSLTFAATHLGAMHFMSRAIPAGFSASAQSLYSAMTNGVAMALALLGAGYLYANTGASGAFLAMALMSLGGAVAAVLLGNRWDGGILST
ncbi:MAG TPA: MFS transporter [Candidatus Cybelea sp.]|nr:MFS transporter [Candidatus Cybelea sp.]